MSVRTIPIACLAAAVISGAGVFARGQGQAPAPPAGAAQAPAAQPQAPPAQGRGRETGPAGRATQAAPQNPYAEAYPQRPPADPAVLERGKALYSVNCAFCHGIDARGGDGGGPNLLRSQLVLSDRNGELIAPVVQNGRPGTTMVPLRLTLEQISDIATYIHSFRVGGYDVTRQPPASILVGDAQAGETAFRARCAGCHSTAGDLKGIGARVTEPRDLQQFWLMPPPAGGRGGPASTVPPTTVAVTLPSGQKIQGSLIKIDDFVVTLEQADGTPRSFSRTGDSPKVEMTDPLKPHRDLLLKYTDKEIHDITAYLTTIR